MIANADTVWGLKPKTAVVDMPEWGDGVQLRVRAMSAAESLAWSRIAREQPDHELVYAMAVGSCDENGAPLFTVEQMPRLLQSVGHKPLLRIANKVFELSGFGKVDESEKNLTGPSSDSPSV